MTHKRGKVLVVEDNAAMAKVVQFNLCAAGYDARVAENGRRALDCLMAEPFDLVITDHQMPEMSGTELARAARRSLACDRTPFIMLTAKRLELDFDALMRDALIVDERPKPFSPRALVEMVGERLARENGNAKPAQRPRVTDNLGYSPTNHHRRALARRRTLSGAFCRRKS